MRGRSACPTAAAAIAILTLSGCAYRLYPPSLPSQHSLRIVAKSPELYSVRVLSNEYQVAADGKVAFEYPWVRRECGIYLFGRIPFNRPRDPAKAKTILLTSHGSVLQAFSLNDISKLPVDSSGSRLLSLKTP